MKKVLVVDDEKSIRLTLKAFLQNDGYQVRIAEDADSALEQIRQEPADIVISDIILPRVTGVELLKSIHAIHPDTQVIMITGEPTLESASEAVRSGACDYLFKPVSKVNLLRAVATASRIKDLEDQNHAYQENLEKMVAERTQQLHEAMESVKQASFDTVLRLSRAAEFKDENTFSHLIRMSEYTALLAEASNCCSENLEAVKFAALLHDIGKIGIPDHILLKPGKLDAEEWHIMKKHAEYGDHILEGADSEVLKIGREIALTHHEKWDGTGYPKGLSGEEIPVFGRIAAIADVFDALSTKRVYKDAYSIEQSFEILKEGRGQHFDPQLVDAFLRLQDRVIQIWETNKE